MSIKKIVFSLFSLFFSLQFFYADLYWENPITISVGEAQFPKSAENENEKYAFWQEIDTSSKKIWLSVCFEDEKGSLVTKSKILGPFTYSGEIPDLYSATVSNDGTVVVAALSSNDTVSTFVTNDKFKTINHYDFPAQNGEFIAPRVYTSKNGKFLLFASLAKTLTSESELSSVSITTHNFFIYSAYSDDGLDWSDFTETFSQSNFKNSFSPVLAYNSKYDYMVFQSQYQIGYSITYQLYGSHSENNGRTWSEPILLTDENSFEGKDIFTNYDNQVPSIHTYNDVISLVWERKPLGIDTASIWYGCINESGFVPRSAEIIAESGNSRRATLFSYSDELFASWFDNSSGTDSVYYAKKDGFSWSKERLSDGKISASFVTPVVNDSKIAFVWQETYGSNKHRIRLLTTDTTCEKPTISPLNYKAGSRTKNKKIRIRVNLPKDASGIDGFRYSWSMDKEELPVLDEMDVSVAANNVLTVSSDEEGEWYFKVCALDKAGNWSDFAELKVIIDLTAPKPPVFTALNMDSTGFMNSNTFSINWNPSPSDIDIVGYNYNLIPIDEVSRKYAVTPRHPLKVTRAELTDYGRRLLYKNKKTIERKRELSDSVKTRLPSAHFKNLENGLYLFVLVSIDEVGHVSECISTPVLLNKYVPTTIISNIKKSESSFGEIKLEVLGKNFLFDGTIEKIVIDKDGFAPYDLTLKDNFKVESDVKVSEINLGNELDEGSYYVGLIHSDRGLTMTAAPAFSVQTNGTVKIESNYEYVPRWRAVSKNYKYRIYVAYVALLLVLIFALIGLLSFGICIAKNLKELYSTKKIVRQLYKGELMASSVLENQKRKGTLKASLAGFTVSLIVFIIVLISIILGFQMLKEQTRTLSKGLHERVNVLLSSLVTGTRSYLPSEDVLELSQLPKQMSSLSEAHAVTITGFALSDAKVQVNDSILYVWASNDKDITRKVNTLNTSHTSYNPGISLLSKNIEAEKEALAQVSILGQQVKNECSDMVKELADLSEERKNANEKRRTEINTNMQMINIRLQNKLEEYSYKGSGSIPFYDDEKLNRENTEYLFYRPVLFRSGTSTDFVRGMVFIKVNTDSLIEEIDEQTRNIIITVLIIAVVAILYGSIAAIIFAVNIVRPIQRLELIVKNISEENDKERLLGGEIKNLPNNEIGRLGDSVNRMQKDLGFNAQELNLQLNASEIQQGLVPLEPLAGNIKQNISKISDKNINEYAYYKGAAGVSGDYFDFQKLDERFYMLVKCDASGHAAPAGILVTIIATLCKRWFENWSYEKNGIKLDEFVYAANDFLESLNIKGKFVAMILCLYDSKTGTVYMCHAGDKIYRIYDSTSHILHKKELTETPAVGPFPSFMVQMKQGFIVQKDVLKHKDILLLYTDGIEENGRIKRTPDFKAIMRPKLNSEGEQIIDEYGNALFEPEKEEFGENRVHDIVEAVLNKGIYILEKEQNPVIGEVLKFDFTTCEGTIEECVSALTSIEKLFRLYKPANATQKDLVEVDVSIDKFLKEHFNLYSLYAIQAKNEKGELQKPKNPNYVYYSYCKEDVQEDDLTVLAIQRP